MAQSEAAKVDHLPELHQQIGCVALESLLAEVPSEVSLLSEEPHGEALKIRNGSGPQWLPLGQLCSEEQHWNSQQCLRKCPADLSWQSCIKRRGCVYVYAAGRNNPKRLSRWITGDLASLLGQCAAGNGLIGSCPHGTEWSPPGERDESMPALVAKAFGGQEVFLVFPLPKEVTAASDALVDKLDGLDGKFQPRPPASAWPDMAPYIEHRLEACRSWYWGLVQQMGPVLEIKTDYAFVQRSRTEFLQVEYGCWRNVLSKSLRMPVQFEYIATADLGNYPRENSFSLDETPGLLEWQPPKWSRSYKYGKPYDVGHQVMANHMDSNKELIAATNLMTNVVPQHMFLNRFAWLSTEYLTECGRKGPNRENVFVIGGSVWPSQPASLGGFEQMQKVGYKLLIPDFGWKVLATPNRGIVAFWIPNNATARISHSTVVEGEGKVQEGLEELNQFVVSIAELEDKLRDRQTPQTFALSDEQKAYRPSASEMFASGWSLECDKS